jgi:23S rRNA (guanosine2251-2'-O)-methyltransferase
MKTEADLVFGINAVVEKLKADPAGVLEILISDAGAARAVGSAARELNIRITRVSSGALDRLAAGQRHQGVVARVTPFRYKTLDDLLAGGAAGLPDRILLLDGITDPRNFGALLRTAEGAGVGHVMIPKDRAAGVTPTAIKASAGAAHHLSIYRVTNLRRALNDLKQAGFWVVGLHGGAAASVYGRTYPEKLAVVLGSEGRGIRPLVRDQCDFLVSIPMSGKVESLNVSVAGAVFLYELLRQRRYVDNRESKR